MNQVDFFKSLSDPTRIDILKLVMAKENICVCELTEQLDLSQPKISRHLALLRNLSILLDERRGQWVYYSLNPNLPDWTKSILDIVENKNKNEINQKNSTPASICCEQ